MFNRARLKLTLWYLAIIMLVSIIFSTAIYQGADTELRRIESRQQGRVQQFRDEFNARPDFPQMFEPIPVEEVRQRFLLTLIFINLGILFVSGVAGYFLAGVTLKPIKDMVDEQNRFITDASHELRTPITVLKSELEVALRDKAITLSDAKNLLASNLEEVNNLEEISDQLIELAQIQKSANFILKPVNFKKIAEDAFRKVQPLARKKKISIEIKTASKVIEADNARITELLVILLDNAIKYSPEKTLIQVLSSISGPIATILVKDHGMGIDDKDLTHVFDRFYRADTSRTKKDIAGYGLGLSIAKKIVEQHHGTIRAESKVGKGTTIIVELPVKQTQSIL